MSLITLDLTLTPRVTLSTGPDCRMELSAEHGIAATPKALVAFQMEPEAWPVVLVEYTGSETLTVEKERAAKAPSSSGSRPSPPVTADDMP